jgi:hypothetical protein
MSKRFLAGVVIAAALVAAGSAASAAPQGEAVHAVCDGEDHDLVVPGNGLWAPAHEVGTHLVFTPKAFRFSDGTEYIKPHVDVDELLECSFETATDSGTVWVVVGGPQTTDD